MKVVSRVSTTTIARSGRIAGRVALSETLALLLLLLLLLHLLHRSFHHPFTSSLESLDLYMTAVRRIILGSIDRQDFKDRLHAQCDQQSAHARSMPKARKSRVQNMLL